MSLEAVFENRVLEYFLFSILLLPVCKENEVSILPAPAAIASFPPMAPPLEALAKINLVSCTLSWYFITPGEMQ